MSTADCDFIHDSGKEFSGALGPTDRLVGTTATWRNNAGELVTVGRTVGKPGLSRIVVTDPVALAAALVACSIAITPDGPS